MKNPYIFNSKETYLAAVAVWKESYKLLSEKILKARVKLKDAERNLCKIPLSERSWVPVTSEYWSAYDCLYDLQNLRNNLRQQASEMIDIRHQMKMEAARQWSENRVGLHA